MEKKQIHRIKTISEFHKLRGLPKPEHPLVSLVDYSLVRYSDEENNINYMQDFYSIALKRNIGAKMRYGQQEYDFDEGLMAFVSPGQVVNIVIDREAYANASGWMLLIHPDFLWKTTLAKKIRRYDFFGYSVNEALFLSEKEEETLIEILQNIKREYQSNIDKFSAGIIISQIELLLNYADRYYNRQFITRKVSSHQVLDRLENLLDGYFREEASENGLPTVQFVADQLNVSPDYLSSMLKVLTGQNTRQHIHERLIEKAKERLSTTTLTVGEIAFELGFEHSQSFSKLFKSKTRQSPLEFRNSFN